MISRAVRLALGAASVCALGAIAVSGQASSTQRPAPTPPAPATGLIAGVVLEADKNVPVEGAVVTLSGPDGGERRAMVDSRGRFVFAGLSAGRYGIDADQFGYLRGTFGKLTLSGGGQSIELREAQRITDAAILMWRLAAISGRVFDDAGEPVTNVSVRALRRSFNRGEAVLLPQFAGYQAVTTDDRGMFRVAQLPPGDYAIGVPARTSTFPLDVMRDALSSGVNLGLAETTLLPNPRNLQVGDLVLTTTSFAPIPPAPIDGRVRVFQTTYYPGTVAVGEAQVITLAPGDERNGIDIRLMATTTQRVSGQVIGPDGPLVSTPFRIFRAGGSPVTDSADFEVATGLTGVDGRFTLLGIPRGEFVLRAPNSTIPTTGSRLGEPPTLWSEERFTVGDADVSNLVVTARRAPRLTGHVDLRGSEPVNTQNVTIIIESYASGRLRAVNPRLGPDYSFSTEVLPGRYLVTAYGASTVQCISTSGGREVSDEPIDVRLQESIEVRIVCSGSYARLSGVVRDAGGRPDSRARVVMFSTDRAHWSGDGYRPLRNRAASVSATGTFSFPQLHAGEYFVAAIPASMGDTWELPRVKDTLTPVAARVTLAAGESRALDLRTVAVR